VVLRIAVTKRQTNQLLPDGLLLTHGPEQFLKEHGDPSSRIELGGASDEQNEAHSRRPYAVATI
jgi:hypothetical protein